MRPYNSNLQLRYSLYSSFETSCVGAYNSRYSTIQVRTLFTLSFKIYSPKYLKFRNTN